MFADSLCLWFFFFLNFALIGLTHNFARFSNGNRPAVHPTGEFVAVGTDNPDALQHFLSILSGPRLESSARGNVLQCYVPLLEYMTDAQWLDSNTVLTASGRGNLNVYHFNTTTESASLQVVGQYAAQ